MREDDAIDEFLRDLSPTIEELVTTAMRHGHALRRLAIFFERSFDGALSGGCGSRREIAARIRFDSRLPKSQRKMVLDALGAAGDSLPAVLFLNAEGCIIVGVRGLSGSTATK